MTRAVALNFTYFSEMDTPLKAVFLETRDKLQDSVSRLMKTFMSERNLNSLYEETRQIFKCDETAVSLSLSEGDDCINNQQVLTKTVHCVHRQCWEESVDHCQC